MQDYMDAAEQISLFCRMNINAKKELPIRSSEMGMLIYLVKAEGDKTPLGVANFFKVTKAMATNMVSSLLRQGYIEKEQSEKDKRSFFLKPTDKALTLVNQTYTEYFKTMALLKERMGDGDFQCLVNMLTKANAVLLEEKENG